jgi:uncharacterized protein (DUF885 family)
MAMDGSRRDFMAGAGMASLAALAGCAAPAARSGPEAASGAAAPPSGDLDGIADAMLADYPENATSLGIDKDALAPLRARLTDRSPAGVETLKRRAAERLAQLSAIPADTLPASARVDVAVARTAHELASEGWAFPFGDVVVLNGNLSYRNAPYVVSQNTGAFIEIPDFLESNQPLANGADAEAWLARMAAYATALDGETERLRHDAGLGVIAPDFILDKALRQIDGALAQSPVEWGFVSALAQRAPADRERIAAAARALATDRIAPALTRQRDELRRHRARATHDAGVWKLPDGDAYYAWALRAGTTTRLTPDEVHRMGLDQLAELQAQMEPILRRRGLTQGSVGARMKALGEDPANLFPNTDAGRQQLLAYFSGVLDRIRPMLPRAFATLVRGNLLVKRVPPAIEAGMPGAYAGPGSMDGSVPGNLYINLADTSRQPRFSLPTLAMHEGIPGHVWQGEYSYRLPRIRALLAFNAYSEGWALYAEQLGDELGLYADDELGRLGYLQSIAFRCCRLVVDTGLHAKRWSREQAAQWMADTNGSSVAEVQSEIDRYCAWPGQACGYKVGHSEINRLRDRAVQQLGARYDLREFDDAVVTTGNVPLTVLGEVIDRFIAATRG